MSREITQADVDEITAYCVTHPNVRIEQDDDDGWCVVISNGKGFKGWVHPLSFLDIIHDAAVGEDTLKKAS